MFEERFTKSPDECDHSNTRVRISSGMNTETCNDCGKTWTPPRD